MIHFGRQRRKERQASKKCLQYSFSVCMGVLPTYMSVQICMPGAHEVQKRALGTLELVRDGCELLCGF